MHIDPINAADKCHASDLETTFENMLSRKSKCPCLAFFNSIFSIFTDDTLFKRMFIGRYQISHAILKIFHFNCFSLLQTPKAYWVIGPNRLEGN